MTLDHPDFVVESFDKPEGRFVVGLAVGGDAVPVPLDDGGKLLERGEALPPYGLAPPDVTPEN